MRFWDEHSGREADVAGEFTVIECESCLFSHVIPLPTPEQLREIYEHEYYTQEKPLYLERMEEDRDWWNLCYQDRYETFEKLLPAERRSILDIGSGTGHFLLHGKQRGWNTIGVEPSTKAAEHSRNLGLNIVETMMTRETVSQFDPVDVVHMSEVLEHLPNPEEMIQWAQQLLKPGGLICVLVPNDYNPLQKALQTALDFAPWWVAPPHHLNYFNFDSLRNLLQRNGFEIVLSEATFPMEMFLLMGDNYVGNDAMGRQCHGKRKQFESNMGSAGINGLKREFYQALATLGIGREVFLVGRKLV